MKVEMNKNNSDADVHHTGTGEIIYNVTVKVEKPIANDWLQWLFSKHIPAIMQTKCFFDYKVVRLLEMDDNEDPTYAIQYFSQSKANYNRYVELHLAAMQNKAFEKWQEQFIAFETVMEIVK